MEARNLIFQIDSEIIADTYSQYPNYLIEYSEKAKNAEKYCIIYFSSNDLYYPNDEQTFRNKVLKKNKFEWYNTRISKGEKHIFIRDIKKQWYLTGINKKINSIEKLYEFLLNETVGYKVVALGSSAGGFAAVLLGSMLNAETILTFNGQFMLSDLLGSSCKRLTSEILDPIIFREKNNPEINKYYSLIPYIKNSKSIYYFYSARSEWDIDQFIHISDLNLQFIPFKTNHHGIPFLKTNLKNLLNMSVDKLQEFEGKEINPIIFSIKIDGIYKTTKDLIPIVLKQLYKRFFSQNLL
jgi:hypothetical protein